MAFTTLTGKSNKAVVHINGFCQMVSLPENFTHEILSNDIIYK